METNQVVNKQKLPLETAQMLAAQLRNSPIYKILYPHREAVVSIYRASQYKDTIVAFLQACRTEMMRMLVSESIVNGQDKSEFLRGKITLLDELISLPDKLVDIERFERELAERIAQERGGN